MENAKDRSTGWKFNREDELCSFYSRDGASSFYYDAPSYAWPQFTSPWMPFQQGASNLLEPPFHMPFPYERDYYYEILTRSAAPLWHNDVLSTYYSSIASYDPEGNGVGRPEIEKPGDQEEVGKLLPISSSSLSRHAPPRVEERSQNEGKGSGRKIEEPANTGSENGEACNKTGTTSDLLPSGGAFYENREKMCRMMRFQDEKKMEKKGDGGLSHKAGEDVKDVFVEDENHKRSRISRNASECQYKENDVTMNITVQDRYTPGCLHKPLSAANKQIHSVFEKTDLSQEHNSSKRCPYCKGTACEVGSDDDGDSRSNYYSSSESTMCVHGSSYHSFRSHEQPSVKSDDVSESFSNTSLPSAQSKANVCSRRYDRQTFCKKDCSACRIADGTSETFSRNSTLLSRKTGQCPFVTEDQKIERDNHKEWSNHESTISSKKHYKEYAQRRNYATYAHRNTETKVRPQCTSHNSPYMNKTSEGNTGKSREDIQRRLDVRTTKSDSKNISQEVEVVQYQKYVSNVTPHTNYGKETRGTDEQLSKGFIWEKLPFDSKASKTMPYSVTKYTECCARQLHSLIRKTIDTRNSVKYRTIENDTDNSTQSKRKKRNSCQMQVQQNEEETLTRSGIDIRIPRNRKGVCDRRKFRRVDGRSTEAIGENRYRNAILPTIRSETNLFARDTQLKICPSNISQDSSHDGTRSRSRSKSKEIVGGCPFLRRTSHRNLSSAPTCEKDCPNSHCSCNTYRTDHSENAVERRTVGDSAINLISQTNMKDIRPHFAQIHTCEEHNRIDDTSTNVSSKEGRKSEDSQNINKSHEKSSAERENGRKIENAAVQTMQSQPQVLSPELEGHLQEILSRIYELQHCRQSNSQDSQVPKLDSLRSQSNRWMESVDGVNSSIYCSSGHSLGESSVEQEIADVVYNSYAYERDLRQNSGDSVTNKYPNLVPIAPYINVASVPNDRLPLRSSPSQEAFTGKALLVCLASDHSADLKISDVILKQQNKEPNDQNDSNSFVRKDKSQRRDTEKNVDVTSSVNREREISQETETKHFTSQGNASNEMFCGPSLRVDRRTKYVEVDRRILRSSEGKLFEEIVLVPTCSDQEVPATESANSSRSSRIEGILETGDLGRGHIGDYSKVQDVRGIAEIRSDSSASTVLGEDAKRKLKQGNAKKTLKRTPHVFDITENCERADVDGQKHGYTFRRALTHVGSSPGSSRVIIRTPIKSGFNRASYQEHQKDDADVGSGSECNYANNNDLRKDESSQQNLREMLEQKPSFDICVGQSACEILIRGTNDEDEPLFPSTNLHSEKTVEPMLVVNIIQTTQPKTDASERMRTIPIAFLETSGILGNSVERLQHSDNDMYVEVPKHPTNNSTDCGFSQREEASNQSNNFCKNNILPPKEETSLLSSTHPTVDDKQRIHGGTSTPEINKSESCDSGTKRLRSCSQMNFTPTFEESHDSVQQRNNAHGSNHELRVERGLRKKILSQMKSQRKINAENGPISDNSVTSVCSLPTIKEENVKRSLRKKTDGTQSGKGKEMSIWAKNMNIVLGLLQQLVYHRSQFMQKSPKSSSSQRTCTSAEDILSHSAKHSKQGFLNVENAKCQKIRQRSKSHDGNTRNCYFSDENIQNLFNCFKNISSKLDTRGQEEIDSLERTLCTQSSCENSHAGMSDNLSNSKNKKDRDIGNGETHGVDADGEYSSSSAEMRKVHYCVYNHPKDTSKPSVNTSKRVEKYHNLSKKHIKKPLSDFSIRYRRKPFSKASASKSYEGHLNTKSQALIGGKTNTNIYSRKMDEDTVLPSSEIIPFNKSNVLSSPYANTLKFTPLPIPNPLTENTQQSQILSSLLAPELAFKEKKRNSRFNDFWTPNNPTTKEKCHEKHVTGVREQCTQTTYKRKSHATNKWRKESSNRNTYTHRTQRTHYQGETVNDSTHWSAWNGNFSKHNVGVYYVDDGREKNSRYTAIRIKRHPHTHDDQSQFTELSEDGREVQTPQHSSATCSQKKMFYIIVCSSEDEMPNRSLSHENTNEKEHDVSVISSDGDYRAKLRPSASRDGRLTGRVFVSLRKCQSQ